MIFLEMDNARAAIALEGAEIKLWDIGDRPLIWDADPAIWPETAPILFPVVGWTRGAEVRVGATTYPLGLHGFARHRRFSVATLSRNEVRLTLAADAQTLALYPFSFELAVTHRLSANALATTLEVTNTGERAMPYACGVHPGFRWPFAGGQACAYRIVFAAAEDPQVPLIGSGGLIAPDKKQLPLDGRILALSDALFANDALCVLNARSQALRFEAPDGAAISLDVEDFPHLALWCRPGAGFLCLEAWTGHSDPQDFSGDLFEKPAMRQLAPGASARHVATYAYVAAQQP